MNDPKAYEQSVLGALLLGSDARPQLKRLLGEGLRFGHFFYGRHREAFAAMVALADRDEPVDLLTVIAELERRGKAKDFKALGGIAAYMHSLPNIVPNASSLLTYARIVMESSAVRQKRTYALAIVRAADDGDHAGIIEAEQRLTSIALPADAKPTRHLGVVG